MKRLLKGLLFTSYRWLTQTILIQLLLTSAVVPILLCWNLTYTPLSIIGNIIHPFFLIPFLGLSSILFFATLLKLPTASICWLLVKLHALWNATLHLYAPALWIRMSWLHLIPASIVYGTIWYSIKAKKDVEQLYKLIILSCLSVVLVSCIQNARPPAHTTILTRGRHTLVCSFSANKTLTLYDKGYISTAANSDSLVDYELMPHIANTYGMPRKIIIHPFKKEGTRLAKVRNALKEWGFAVCDPITYQNYAEFDKTFQHTP